MSAPANPFATRRLRPGALPFVGAPVVELAQRVERGGSFEIVGPHGTGKSTLTRSIIGALGDRDVAVTLFVVRAGGGVVVERSPGRGPPVHVVDGFDDIGPAGRAWHALRACIGARALVVTAHVSRGLAPLYQTAVDDALAERVTAMLLERSGSTLVRPDEVLAALRARGGNLREALFDLYDAHETRARTAAAKT